MGYEERYKELFSKLVSARTDKSKKDCAFCSVIDSIMSELVESEDERIRKKLISFFQRFPYERIDDAGTNANEAIAWLEKQGKNISLPKFTFDDVLALQYCMETAKKVQEDKELYEQLQSLHDRLHDAYWLEKQSEQKPHEEIVDEINRKAFPNHYGDAPVLDIEIPFGAKDSELEEVSYSIPNGYHAEIEDNKVVIKKGEQKPAWSEEDKEMSRFIGNAITANDASEYLESKAIQVIDAHVWLDGLRDRVQSQPKQEWSEEDEYYLNSCITKIEIDIQNWEGHGKTMIDVDKEIISWLKSLKERVQPQKTWKPSDEQINAFEQVYDWYNNNFAASETLTSLYQDLKKLKA